MASEQRPLHVLVVSVDISLLHEVAWMLEAVGYHVQTSNDFAPDALWRRCASPDVLIVDGRDLAEPSADVFQLDSPQPQYRVFLCDPAKASSLASWYAAGAHDAVRVPLSRGELLTRLRTGARYLEFERRLKERSSFSDVADMYSRRGLLRKLSLATANNELESTPHTLLATSIDWYAEICRKCGEAVGGDLLATAARAIRRSVGGNAICAYLGDGRFVTLLAGQPVAEVQRLAEALASDFSKCESHGKPFPLPTLTSAIVPWNEGTKPNRLLADALEALALASLSGGDCVIQQGEFSPEWTSWQEEMSAGNPFANVVAQDIMEPFPALLDQESESDALATALQRAQVPVRPYVDGEGRLVGLAGDDGSGEEGQGDSLTKPETIAHDTSFPEIYEAFCARGCAALVVTAGDQPLGYITCEGFLSMVDPIYAESFTQTDKAIDDVAYLLVPATLGESDVVASDSPVESNAATN